MHPVFFVGAGPGDPELITVKALRLIEAADLVLYAGSLVPKEVVASAKPGAVVIDSAALTLEETHALLRDAALSGKRAVRVHTGDPSLYGTVQEQARLLEDEGVAWEIVPGVTASFAAAAKAGVSFTQPGGTQTLIITRLAGRTPVPDQERLRDLAGHGASLAVYLSAGQAEELQAELLAAGRDPESMIVIGHRIGHPGEAVHTTPLIRLAETVALRGITRQAVFLVPPATPDEKRVSSLYDPAFGHGFRKATPAPEADPAWSPMAVYALTRQGAALGRTLARGYGATLFAPARLAEEYGATPFTALLPLVARTFPEYRSHVFLSAAGIAVRAIAPHCVSKLHDPAVLVVDQAGEHVVSLLSGHLGRANDLARAMAGRLGGRAVITTATDSAGVPAIDILARDAGLVIGNPEAIQRVNAAFLEGIAARLFDPEDRLGISGDPLLQPYFMPVADESGLAGEGPAVRAHWSAAKDTGALCLYPRVLALGLGCRKDTPAEELLACVRAVFAERGLALESVALLASALLKRHEPGLLATAKALGVGTLFFSNSELAAMSPPNPSQRVKRNIGVESVCEAAAMRAAKTSELLVQKTIRGRVTLAVALIRD